MMLDPSLRGKAVAVCGSTENRHGIVLAKSQLAKKAGVKTGMVAVLVLRRQQGFVLDEALGIAHLADIVVKGAGAHQQHVRAY